MKSSVLSAVCIALVLLASGCSSSTTEKSTTEQNISVTETDAASGESAVASFKAPQVVSIENISCDAWKQSLIGLKGRIVVVDTWATWCMPCREEFPKLLELESKYASQGVTCMSVSVDELDQKEAAFKFLQQKNAKIPNYLIDDKPEAWWDLWEIKGIPIVLVFGLDGKLVRKFDNDDPDNQFSYEDVEQQVQELLARPSH